jgi:hypothetical protein
MGLFSKTTLVIQFHTCKVNMIRLVSIAAAHGRGGSANRKRYRSVGLMWRPVWVAALQIA